MRIERANLGTGETFGDRKKCKTKIGVLAKGR